MISGGIEVYLVAKINLMLEVKIGDDPLMVEV